MVSSFAKPLDRPLRLLQLEDNPDDAALAASALEEGGFTLEETRADRRSQFEASLTSGTDYDLVLADYSMPGYDGREALAFARAMRPDIPFIVISGKIGEENAIEMLKAGATDYVLKQRMGRLVPAVTRALRDRERERIREASEHVIRSLSERLRERGLLEEVIGQMPAGVLIAEAPAGEVILANRSFLDIVNLPRESLRTLDDLARNLPWRSDGVRCALADLPCKRALGSGAAVASELLHFAGSDGARRRTALAHAAPVRGPDGRIVAVVTTLADVSERLSLEEDRDRLRDQVADERELLRAVVEDMPAGLLVVDGAGRIRFSNPTAKAILQAPLEPGTPLVESEHALYPPGASEPCTPEQRPLLRAAREGIALREVEYEVRPPKVADTAERRTVLISVAPVRGRSGAVLAAVSTFQDVTERRRLEAELREQVRLRDRIVTIVSHDLRGPLGAITLSAQGLRKRTSDEGTSKSCDLIARSAHRMERITRDLLDLGRHRAGGAMPIAPEARDLRPLVESAVEEAAAAFPHSPIQLSAGLDALPAWVDPERIAQALANLLSNAARYGARGAPIRVGLRRLGEEVEISVENSGDPIPPERLPHIFEPFQQATSAPGSGSVGLGLFIVQEIAKAHGGRVEARSSAESGTRLAIRLPELRARAAVEQPSGQPSP